MVQFTSFLVAVAALSTAVSAAPLPRPAPCMGSSCTPQPVYEQPKYEAPQKSEQPKYEAPKYEAPKYEQPKYEPEPVKEVKPSSIMHEAPKPSMYEPEPVKEVKPSSMMHEAPKPSMYEPEPVKEVKPSSMMHEPSPTQEKEVKPTGVVEPPKYGSGSPPPEQQKGYNDCVNKCMATYGAPPTQWAPPPAPPSEAGGSTGGEYVVLVAPTDGVLRYVPPMIDVPVGKTVKFVWNGTKDHTVSKGSALDLCNKTAEAFFTSGPRKGPNEFTQVVNNTDPTYFYCAVSPHCSKGMFGVVNMPKAPGANVSVASMLPLMTAQSPDLAAAWASVHSRTQGTPADKWGDDFDLSAIPVENREGALSTIMYHRDWLAANPGVQELNSGAALPAGVTEFKFPQDVSLLLSNSASNPAGGPDAAAGGAPSGTPTGPAPNPTQLANNSNAAGSLKSSGLMVAVVAILATMVAL